MEEDNIIYQPMFMCSRKIFALKNLISQGLKISKHDVLNGWFIGKQTSTNYDEHTIIKYFYLVDCSCSSASIVRRKILIEYNANCLQFC